MSHHDKLKAFAVKALQQVGKHQISHLSKLKHNFRLINWKTQNGTNQLAALTKTNQSTNLPIKSINLEKIQRIQNKRKRSLIENPNSDGFKTQNAKPTLKDMQLKKKRLLENLKRLDRQMQFLEQGKKKFEVHENLKENVTRKVKEIQNKHTPKLVIKEEYKQPLQKLMFKRKKLDSMEPKLQSMEGKSTEKNQVAKLGNDLLRRPSQTKQQDKIERFTNQDIIKSKGFQIKLVKNQTGVPQYRLLNQIQSKSRNHNTSTQSKQTRAFTSIQGIRDKKVDELIGTAQEMKQQQQDYYEAFMNQFQAPATTLEEMLRNFAQSLPSHT